MLKTEGLCPIFNCFATDFKVEEMLRIIQSFPTVWEERLMWEKSFDGDMEVENFDLLILK